MRVKRLEIQGFKSFKDKTVIHFDHGITGIVGPNGCGKSNIVDAFFWVMGEQSYKHMRGASSDDLIFNGSSKYTPLGLAEATLVMETDAPNTGDTQNAPAGASVADIPLHLRAKEISVTRRLYRTGEGEYFINGVQARLKDIQELFMDTGVGAKGYSVIEQGQIGKIVNSKPEERRLLIEEAAGIAKYKARKKESLRKMEATQANISRLTDVIQEIERSLASLERQAQKAHQYKKYKAELLDKEMTWGRRKTLVLRQKLEALTKEKESLEHEVLGLRSELQSAENAIEVDQIAQLTDTKLAEEVQAIVQHEADELAHERSALDLSRRRQNDLESQLDSLAAEKTELNTSIAIEKERISSVETEAAGMAETFREATQKASNKDSEVRSARGQTEAARRELETIKRNLMSGIAQASDLNSRAASLLSKSDSARAQADRLAQQAQVQTEKLAAQREEAEIARAAAETAKITREERLAEKREQAEKIQAQDQTLRAADRERDEAHRKLTQVRSRLQSLEELAAAFEGFGDGAKAALEWSNGKLSAVAEAFDVTTGYETALSNWLENRLENLISNDSETALDAIHQLRDDGSGRVSIYLGTETSTTSKSFGAIQTELAQAGFEVAGELSQFAKSNSPVASRLVSQVCVVKDFAAMNTFIAGNGVQKLQGWSIISFDGNALDCAGGVSILRGGSQSESDGLASVLKRKQAIEDLRIQVSQAETAHAELETKATSARQALELARSRQQALQAELQTIEIQAATLDRDVHQMNRTLKDSETQLELTELESKEMQEEAESARLEREAIEGELNAIVSSRSDLEEKISSGDTQMAEQETRLRELEVELQQLRVNEASLRERSASITRELEAGRSLVRDRERRLNEINRILDRATQEQEHFSGSESGLAEKIERLTLSLAENREKLSVIKDRLEQSSAKLKSGHDRIKELHKNGDSKTGQTTQLAIETEKVAGELSHLIQNLEEKYGAGCLENPVTSHIQEEMTEPVVTAEMTAEEEQALGEEVERLRERIRRLGEVNVMAIEEFEELKKRYDYLTTEKSDLDHSIQNLQDAIDHINKTSEDRFKRAFDAIADRFERLFPIIFGGGQAKLSLVYPEGSSDILEAGVDILAQPPGKKVVNIGLLSGGEKALTAVSLIFAIFMVKPSPFCVLDEVDAPLDDANIGKFNALLREMSVKSQFILITHNKKTMELNDTLYGVTMEEPGVSKMVSIELH